jgi:hypothetical protein
MTLCRLRSTGHKLWPQRHRAEAGERVSGRAAGHIAADERRWPVSFLSCLHKPSAGSTSRSCCLQLCASGDGFAGFRAWWPVHQCGQVRSYLACLKSFAFADRPCLAPFLRLDLKHKAQSPPEAKALIDYLLYTEHNAKKGAFRRLRLVDTSIISDPVHFVLQRWSSQITARAQQSTHARHTSPHFLAH